MTSTDLTAKKERPAHLFRPGQSGNPRGRPKGARNVLAEDFLRAMSEDFAKHGVAAIEKVRTENPSAYLRAVVDLMPKEGSIDVTVAHSIDAVDFASKFKAAVELLHNAPGERLKVINGPRS